MKTALTRDFRETVQARVKRDATFRKRLLSEAIESLLSGEVVRSRHAKICSALAGSQELG
jgi:hypothetical protein